MSGKDRERERTKSDTPQILVWDQVFEPHIHDRQYLARCSIDDLREICNKREKTQLHIYRAAKREIDELTDSNARKADRLRSQIRKISDLEKQLADREKQLADREKQLAEAQQQLADREKQLAEQKEYNFKLYNSYIHEITVGALIKKAMGIPI